MGDTVRVGDLERALDHAFPVDRAEEWDRVGLLAGDPAEAVTGVVLALDPTPDAIRRAAELGANVLVTHHPAFLKMPERLVGSSGPAGLLSLASRLGVALMNAHTNLDRDDRAQALMPTALGLTIEGPLERSLLTAALVTVFTPARSIEDIRSAMVSAGAGRVGNYEECSFRSSGTGGFLPPASGAPAVLPDDSGALEEIRLEMICPAGSVVRVTEAAATAHPYEEPLIVSREVRISRNRWRLGRVCRTEETVTLRQLADRAAGVYGVSPRVWGDPDTLIDTVGCTTGSGGSLLGAAASRGVEAFIAGEVRYHDAMDALHSGICVIELGHDVSEWPLVSILEEVVRGVPGISPDSVHALPPSAGWWVPKERTNA